MDIEGFLDRRGGIARTGQLLAAGFSRNEIARARKGGLLHPGRGLVALPGHREDFRQAFLSNGLLTCASAASHYGLWPDDRPPQPHLLCDHGRASGATVHRGRRFPSHPILPIAGVEDVVIHGLGCLPEAEAVAMAESAIKLRGVSRQSIESELRAKSMARHRERLGEVDLTADSYPEVVARLFLKENGFSFQAQQRIPGIGRVDFLIWGFLIFELDGFAYHGSREAKSRDDKRNRMAARIGYPILRYLPEYIRFQPELVLLEIRETLEVNGFRVAAPSFPFLAG